MGGVPIFPHIFYINYNNSTVKLLKAVVTKLRYNLLQKHEKHSLNIDWRKYKNKKSWDAFKYLGMIIEG
jgi:hypothetical protein